MIENLNQFFVQNLNKDDIINVEGTDNEKEAIITIYSKTL